MSEKTPFVDDRLDRLLAEVAADRPDPGESFLARLQADATAFQPAPAAIIDPPRPALRWREVLGGWLGIGGLATASLVGLWIGIAPPEVLDPVLGGTATVELLPDILTMLEEG